MPNTRIKICGITHPEDAALAAELGADAIGLNFVKGPRQISLDAATQILRSLHHAPIPPIPIALCALPSRDFPTCLTAGQIGAKFPIIRFQVYGNDQALLLNDDESPSFWLVASVASRQSLIDLVVRLEVESLRPQAILLDTASSQLGGTGQSFDWNWIAEARDAGELEGLPPLILAGGLTPDNVADAIRIAKPYAVDVSSGVEFPGKPGIKDAIKMRDFIQAVKGAGSDH